MSETNYLTNDKEAPFFHYILYAFLGSIVGTIAWFMSAIFFTVLSLLTGADAYYAITWGGLILLPVVVIIQMLIGGIAGIIVGIFYNRSQKGLLASRRKKFSMNALWVAIISAGLQAILFFGIQTIRIADLLIKSIQ